MVLYENLSDLVSGVLPSSVCSMAFAVMVSEGPGDMAGVVLGLAPP